MTPTSCRYEATDTNFYSCAYYRSGAWHARLSERAETGTAYITARPHATPTEAVEALAALPGLPDGTMSVLTSLGVLAAEE